MSKLLEVTGRIKNAIGSSTEIPAGFRVDLEKLLEYCEVEKKDFDATLAEIVEGKFRPDFYQDTPASFEHGPTTSFGFEEIGTNWSDKPYVFSVNDGLVPEFGKEVTISYNPDTTNENNHFTDWSVK